MRAMRAKIPYALGGQALHPAPPTLDAVTRSLASALSGFGCETVCMTLLPNLDAGAKDFTLAEVKLLSTMPLEYMRAYDELGFSGIDRGFVVGVEAKRPFKWIDVQQSDTSAKSKALMGHAHDFHISRSIIVPVRDQTGCSGLVGLSGRAFDPQPELLPMIEAICNQAFDWAQANLGHSVPPASLTLREREVLTWIANGKSAWEVGEILNIGARTVEAHTISINQKLNAGNRSHAVAIAIRHKLIDI